MSIYDILFGEKAGSFITNEDGRVVFIGGPGAGGGGASGGGQEVTLGNVEQLARDMDETQLYDTLSEFNHAHSQAANAYNDVERTVRDLTAGNLSPEQAVNTLSVYPLTTDAEHVLKDASSYLSELRVRRNHVGMLLRMLTLEQKRRMQG